MAKFKAPRIISGTHGYLYWDGDLVYEVSSVEASIKTDREDVTFAGDMWKDSKLMSLGGEGTIKIRKVFSRAKTLAKAFSEGKDPRSELIVKLEDPDSFGSERVALHNCWFNDVPLASFENGKIVEEEFSFGFSSFDYLDSIEE